MFLKEVKATLTIALQNTFNGSYPEVDFRNLHIDTEYPVNREDYPGVWVDFETEGDLAKAGIDEFAQTYIDVPTGDTRILYKWRFQGWVTYTIGALTSLERDRLFDEVVRCFAFSADPGQIGAYRSYVENSPLIAMNVNFDQIAQRGGGAAPGTPWGTTEVIYETTVAVQLVGEFISDAVSQTLYPLASVVVEGIDDSGKINKATAGAATNTAFPSPTGPGWV